MRKIISIIFAAALVLCLSPLTYAAAVPNGANTDLSFTYGPAQPGYTVSVSGSWTQGDTSGLTITCSADLSKFIGVKVDGILLDAANYTAVSGSTIITIKPEYLATLAVGEHSIELFFTDGSVQTWFTVRASGGNGGNGGNSGDSGSGSGSGGGSGGSFTTTTAPTTTWLEQNPADTAAGAAKDQKQDYVRTRGTGEYGVRGSVWAKFAGLKYEHDTVADGAVQVRLYINNPEKFYKDTMVSGYVKGSIVDSVRGIFEKWFKNKVRAVHFDQQTDWGQPVGVAARVDLAGMSTNNLYFYSYDRKTNTYRRIEKPAYWIDKNGYLHFSTAYAGEIIISEGPLEKK